MNIHEHQAKEILRRYDVHVPQGEVLLVLKKQWKSPKIKFSYYSS